MYYKHQKGPNAVAVIPGVSMGSAFIQVITDNDSYFFKFNSYIYKRGEILSIGDSTFSKDGVKLHIEENGVSIHGEINYTGLTPIKYDIMGPFRYLPMECRHRIVSLYHQLDGSFAIGGKIIDFTGGAGYIEGDSGSSFPKNYIWIHCNDFPEKACIMASVADIPLLPFSEASFRGCICIVYINGIEYRLATYLGVRILHCDEDRIVLIQGKLSLEIDFTAGNGYKLIAPEKGAMVREIRERIACNAGFRFIIDGKTVFEQHSDHASLECVNMPAGS